MPLITFGSDSKLKLKIPSKGDTNWSEHFKTYFVDPIVEHDHSGIDGRGKQITANAIEDGAIGPEHINFDLTDLKDVSSAGLANGKYLKYENNSWQAADVDQAQTTISNAGSGVDSIGDDETGIGLGPNSEIFIEDVQGGDSLDFTQRESGTIVGVTFVIDSATTAGKSAIFNNLKECVIISNIDIEVQGQLDKCIIIMENDETTPGSVGCNLTLSGSINGATEDFFLVKSSRILSDTIEVINGSDQINVLFLDSEVKTKQLNFQLNAGSNGNYSRITRSNVEVTEKITNSKDLTTLSGVKKLQLIGSKVSTPLFQHLVGGSLTNYTLTNAFINVDDESELKQISTNLTKIWKQADNRWNYLVSPSGINKFITADASGVPTEFSLSNGHVLKGGASGFTSEEFKFANLDDVNTSGLATNEPLIWNGSQFVPGPALSGTNTINTTGGGISITSTPTTGQYLAWNGSAFVPTTPEQDVTEEIIFKKIIRSNNQGSTTGDGPWAESLGITVAANQKLTVQECIVLGHSADVGATITGYYDTYKSGDGSTGSVTADRQQNLASSMYIATMISSSTVMANTFWETTHPSAHNTDTQEIFQNTKDSVSYYNAALGGNNSGNIHPTYRTSGGLWSSGAAMYCRIDVNYATPTADEFGEILIWFKLTTYNG